MTQLTLRQSVYLLLESNRGLWSKFIVIFLMLLIFLNVVAVMVESVRSFHLAYKAYFYNFELFSVIVFTIEYGLRIWIAPEDPEFNQKPHPRLAFMRSGMAIIDLLAIAPFYLSMFIGVDTRILRGLRLLRIFKLTRYSSAMELMVTVIKKELPNIGSAMFVMLILIVIAASGIYLVEREVQTEHFGSIPAALWWATVTLTTVGYGDVVPVTMMGRVFGMLLMLTGVGMAALPAGILASGYSRELSLRREKYQEELDEALEDGEITAEEETHLARVREDLGIRTEELGKNKVTRGKVFSHCPHCGKSILSTQPE